MNEDSKLPKDKLIRDPLKIQADLVATYIQEALEALAGNTPDATDSLKSALQEATYITDQLLQIERLESWPLENSPTSLLLCSVSEANDQVITQVKLLAKQKHLELINDLDQPSLLVLDGKFIWAEKNLAQI